MDIVVDQWGDEPVKREIHTTLLMSPIALPVKESADWIEHEHVSEHVQLGAQKLVHLVGNIESG